MIKKKRDLLSLKDLTQKEILSLLQLATEMKNDRTHSCHLLQGKMFGLIFQKPSNRTRVSFEVGIYQMGGSCVYLGPEEINLGVRETTEDVAKTLSRYLDGIVGRVNSHQDVVDLAKFASIPVINGLSDLYHPCQALADLQTIKDRFGNLQGLKLAYIGDGNNVCHSLMIGCSKVGMNVNIACPKGYEPSADVLKISLEFASSNGSKIEITDSPQSAAMGAHVIYSDVWVSMGQEEETKKRLKNFEGFQINNNITQCADRNFIFMHCLPAHRGEEVSAEVIDGSHSIVFDQAENRLHSQKAVLNFLYNTW